MLASQSIATAVVTPTAFAAPLATETVDNPGGGVFLWVKVGATATTVTVERPGSHPSGDVVDDLVLTGLTNTERVIPIGVEFRDPSTCAANVTFSQVVGVTALLLTVD